MYDLLDYLNMVRDRVRTPAYLAAMREVIRPGQVVLEIGTGPGFFAIQACQLGARHVYALEPNDAIGLGPRLAAEHGCSDRITFIQQLSTAVTLPERADVLIEDMRGVFPLLGAHLPSVRDARARLLRADAIQMPLRDRLFFAPSEAPHDLSVFGPEAPSEVDGIRIGSLLERVREGWMQTRGDGDAYLAPAANWATIDYTALTSDDVLGEASWTVARAGRFAGFQSWFRAELTDRVVYETSPSVGRTVYSAAFFPLTAPVMVAEGDRIEAGIRAKFDGSDYVWGWDTTIRPVEGQVRSFRQSTLKGQLLSRSRRARRSSTYSPSRTLAVAVMTTIIEAVDGALSLDAIVDQVLVAHPGAFPDRLAALRWTAERLATLDEDAAL